LTDIAVEMEGESAAGYKRIQRFLKAVDPRVALWRRFQEEAEFVIGDPTEIERPQAWKTEYVGTLKDGKTQGFWALVLGTPYRGPAMPCGLVTYSSKTIAQSLDSRNLNHFRSFAALKDMLGERPLVLDREFSYLELLLNFEIERIHWVIRLKLRSHPPKFYDQDGLQIYFKRMKIEETFRDLKTLLGMTKLMNKQQRYMEKILVQKGVNKSMV